VWVGVIGRQSAIEFVLMGLRNVKGFSLCSNAVPDLFYE
jgi:hypothetical protein